METILLSLESFLYFLILQIIVFKIENYRENRIVFFYFGFLLHIFLVFVGIVVKQEVFIFIHSCIQIFQIVLVKLTWKKAKISSIIGIYFLIYSVIAVILLLIENSFFIPVKISLILEFVLHCLSFIVCVLMSYNENIYSIIRFTVKILSLKIKILLICFFVMNMWVLALISSFILAIPDISENLYFNVMLRVTIVLMSSMLFVILPVMIIIVLSNFYLKSQNERFQKDIEAQAKHYSDLAKANYELRRFKHDFGNMKIGLSQSLKEGDCAGALDMLNGAAIDMQRSSEDIVGFDTGNGIVDAILADKQSRAKTNNTMIIFSGSIPPNSIAPTDLCIIFGNTLDNAIEACDKISGDTEKIIFVTCKCNSGFVFIDITNPVSEDVVIHGTNVDTSKSDKASHGYGLYSLNKTLKKLDGDVKLSCENKIFKVEIDFSIEQNIIYA
jgi:hypothetical protein